MFVHIIDDNVESGNDDDVNVDDVLDVEDVDQVCSAGLLELWAAS